MECYCYLRNVPSGKNVHASLDLDHTHDRSLLQIRPFDTIFLHLLIDSFGSQAVDVHQ